MIPLRDENPSRSFPFVTYLLIGVNVLVFVYEVLLPAPSLRDFFQGYGVVPVRFTGPPRSEAYPFGIPWMTLLSSMFIHGDVLHLGGNMLYLWIFGDNVEDAVGHLRFAIFYALCGLVAAVCQIAATPASGVPLVGASGAIAGTLGAYLLLYPAARIRTLVVFFFFVRIVSLPALVILALWFLWQVVSAPSGEGAGTAFFAHIGGFVAGMVFLGLFVRRRKRR